VFIYLQVVNILLFEIKTKQRKKERKRERERERERENLKETNIYIHQNKTKTV
jgi:hypothetical protein